MTVLRGLLESGETEKAIGYLEQITDSSENKDAVDAAEAEKVNEA